MSFMPEHLAQLFFKDLFGQIEYDRPTFMVDDSKKGIVVH